MTDLERGPEGIDLPNVAAALLSETSPADLYPCLFARLDAAPMAIDKKLVADATPLFDREVIEGQVASLPQSARCDWLELLPTWFDLPSAPGSVAAADNLCLEDRIEQLWGELTRTDPSKPPSMSLIPLPSPYVVPGGMFRECYYWDSYFVLLGLRNHPQLARGMVDNLAYLIDRYGFVPNGNRTYYLSRSQPPLFYLAAVESGLGNESDCWGHYLPQLLAEHAFWVRGADALTPGQASARAVCMPDGALLNRYYDDDPRPRPEAPSGRDQAVATLAGDRPASDVFRDIRAACESGWDFSSRWLGDRRKMETIRTTKIVPADLNAFLFALELAITSGAGRRGEGALARDFSARVERRRAAMTDWLWNEEFGIFDDRDLERGLRGAVTAAALVPLFTRVATDEQALRTAQCAEAQLLGPGGLLTSDVVTGEQWDAPNGWAPLQWMAAVGLRHFGYRPLADEIVRRWVGTVRRVYADTGRLTEKYDVLTCRPGGGGEYALQDGFGWTNGIMAAMLATSNWQAP